LKVVGWIHLAQNSAVAGFFEHCNELSGAIIGGKFLVQLKDCWYLMEDFSS
jgi:hypothetical protein